MPDEFLQTVASDAASRAAKKTMEGTPPVCARDKNLLLMGVIKGNRIDGDLHSLGDSIEVTSKFIKSLNLRPIKQLSSFTSYASTSAVDAQTQTDETRVPMRKPERAQERAASSKVSRSQSANPRTLNPHTLNPRTLNPHTLNPRTLNPHTPPQRSQKTALITSAKREFTPRPKNGGQKKGRPDFEELSEENLRCKNCSQVIHASDAAVSTHRDRKCMHEASGSRDSLPSVFLAFAFRRFCRRVATTRLGFAFRRFCRRLATSDSSVSVDECGFTWTDAAHIEFLCHEMSSTEKETLEFQRLCIDEEKELATGRSCSDDEVEEVVSSSVNLRPRRTSHVVHVKQEDVDDGLIRCPDCQSAIQASERGCNL